MKEINKIPCRKSITSTLVELGQKDKDIVVVTSDATGSATLDDFVKTLPQQFVEVGIAEQNSVGVSAGLASTGKKVFVFGPACFYVARSLEQVKVDMAYSQMPVKIIGVSGGVAYSQLGATHHSLHDIAVSTLFETHKNVEFLALFGQQKNSYRLDLNALCDEVKKIRNSLKD